MKPCLTLPIAAAVAAFAVQPALAQEQPADIDMTAPVTLEGTATTVIYGVKNSWLQLDSNGKQWEVRLPGSRALLDMNLGAEILNSGAEVKLSGHQLTDKSCDPRCKAAADELTVGDPAKTYSMAPAPGGGGA